MLRHGIYDIRIFFEYYILFLAILKPRGGGDGS